VDAIRLWSQCSW